jgi:hypothetical protein
MTPVYTLVPHPTNKPNPSVDSTDVHDEDNEIESGYEGIKEGAIMEIKAGLVIKPARIGRFSSFRLGRKAQSRMKAEMPKTRPLCNRRPNEPPKRSKAPSVV